jgi:hypothetical protein
MEDFRDDEQKLRDSGEATSFEDWHQQGDYHKADNDCHYEHQSGFQQSEQHVQSLLSTGFKLICKFQQYGRQSIGLLAYRQHFKNIRGKASAGGKWT